MFFKLQVLNSSKIFEKLLLIVLDYVFKKVSRGAKYIYLTRNGLELVNQLKKKLRKEIGLLVQNLNY